MIGEPAQDGGSQRTATDSRNSAFAAFLVNYTELETLRQFLPAFLQRTAQIIAEELPHVAFELARTTLIPYMKKALGKRFAQQKVEQDLRFWAGVGQPSQNEKLTVALAKSVGEQAIVVGYRRMVDRLTLVMIVSYLETYLTDTFKNTLHQHPAYVAVFDSNGRARDDYQGGKYETLEEAMVRIHHRELNFQDVGKAEAAYQKLGLSLLPHEDWRERLTKHIATRHLLVHRDGQINREYLTKVGEPQTLSDTYLSIAPHDADTAVLDVILTILHIEEQIVRANLLDGPDLDHLFDRELTQKMQHALAAYRMIPRS